MNADEYEPLPADMAARWADFPHWNQSANFAILVGLVTEEIRLDYARMRLPARAEVNQPAGIMHGGAIATLIDSTVVPVVGAGTDSRTMVTISMTIDYVSAVRDEDAVCEAWVTRRGRSIVFCRAEVRGADSGTLCATASLVYKP